MTVDELRIGNLIFDAVPKMRTEVDLGFFKDIYDENAFIDEFEPIPLTEEWLVNFGFVKYDQMGNNSFWNYNLPNKKGWNLAIFHDGIYVSFATLNWDNCPIIKHVHQLQNLFYSLSGEEL